MSASRNIIVAGIFAAALTGCHGRGHQSADKRAAKINEAVTEKLELNDEQAGKFKQVTSQGLVIFKEFEKQRGADLTMLIQQISADELDKDKLLAVYQARRAVLDQQIPGLLDKLVEFHKTLNANQKAGLLEKLKKIEEHGHRD